MKIFEFSIPETERLKNEIDGLLEKNRLLKIENVDLQSIIDEHLFKCFGDLYHADEISRSECDCSKCEETRAIASHDQAAFESAHAPDGVL